MKRTSERLRTTSANPKKEGGVVISPNLRKEKERIDSNGNVIDPKTKQIIKPNTDTKE